MTTRHIFPVPVTVGRTGHADQTGRLSYVTTHSLPEHLERWGPRPPGGPWLVDAADAANLTGCGGGHFPAAAKWRAALARCGSITLVANAAEGEPLSAKDATLLRLRPHLVLDGLAMLAEVLGAAPLLWIHEDDGTTWKAVVEAVNDRRRAGLVDRPVTIAPVMPGYLSGESSAIKHALDGGPALPTFQRSGSSVRPSPQVVVQNVETLAHLARLSRLGPASTTSRPSVAAVPSRLLTILTPHDRCVIEPDVGTCLGSAVATATGTIPTSFTPVLLGGYGGMWARWSRVADVPVDESALHRYGLTLGPGIVAPLPSWGCGVATTAAITSYLAASSARQCGPCTFGLPAVDESLHRLAAGRPRRGEMVRLSDDLEAVAGRGACHHPDGVVRLVRSALSVFREDMAAHASGRPCAGSERTIPIPIGVR